MATVPEDLWLYAPREDFGWRTISIDKVVAHAKGRGAKRLDDLRAMLMELHNIWWTYGYSFDVMVSMSYLETDCWRADHWVKHLNPGSIGITDSKDFGYHWGSGVAAARGMATHFMAYVDGYNNEYATTIPGGLQANDPRYIAVLEAGMAGFCVTVEDLGNGHWASDPEYAKKVTARYDLLANL